MKRIFASRKRGFIFSALALIIVAAIPIVYIIITSGAQNVSYYNELNSQHISWSHRVGNDSNRMLVVGIGLKAGNTMDMNIQSVTYGNQDMMYVNNSSVISGTEGDFNKTMLYYLPNPDSGSHSISIGTLGECTEISAGATSLSNVYQGIPEAVATNTTNDAAAEAIAVNLQTVTQNTFVVSSMINSLGTVSLTATEMEESGHNSVHETLPQEAHAAVSSVAFTSVADHPRISIAYDSTSTRQSFAAGKLERTLLGSGYLPVKVDVEQSTGQEEIIVQVSPSGGSIQPEGFEIIKSGETYTINAADESGAMYGLLEISDQISANDFAGVADTQINPKFPFRAIKVNTPWSSYRNDESLDQHFETMTDVTYWDSFLDMMAEQRFNKLTLWNLHPFPYLIRPTNFPEATPFTDEELERWQFLYRNIFRIAKERGIEVYLVNWNIFVSEAFKDNYDPDARTDMMGYNGEAYTTPQIEKYTKESVTQVLNEYPDLAGFGFTLGENMSGMTPEEREQWGLDTIVAGMQEASRPSKLIHRMPLSATQASGGETDVTTELMTREAIESITGITTPIDTEIKFNGSHGYSSTKLLSTHGGSITDAYWNPAPTQYRVDWMIRNEDFYILRWAQPDFIREHIANNGQSYVGGYYIGSENYYPALNYMDMQTSSSNWINYGFQRQWMYYMTWGRLLFDPSTPDSRFETEFNRRYGNNAGADLLEAYTRASDFPHLFGAYTKTSWDFTSYSEGFLTPTTSLGREFMGRRMSAFHSLEQLMKYPVTDPDYVSIRDYATHIGNGDSLPDGKISPLELADTLDQNAEEALRAIDGLTSPNPEFPHEVADVKAWSYLGQYFADKLRAGVELVKYDTGQAPDKGRALEFIEAAKVHWESLIANTEHRYQSIPLAHLYGGDFSWKEFLSEVEWDITFVEEYEK